MKAQVKRQEAVAESVYKRELNTTQQALKIAESQGISRTQTDTPAEQLPDSDLFLLGRPMLQARLEGLQASGPTYDLDYEQNRAMLATLNVGPTLDEVPDLSLLAYAGRAGKTRQPTPGLLADSVGRDGRFGWRGCCLGASAA